MSRTKRVTVVGAGLAGCLMANYLAHAGHRVRLIERRADFRGKSLDEGRSINLALSTRGLYALGRVGLTERVLEHAVPMKGRMIHATDGDLSFQRYGPGDEDVIQSVSRTGLNVICLEGADALENVSCEFRKKCRQIDIEAPSLEIEDLETGQREVIESDAIIGCDGAFSNVRASLQRRSRFDYQQFYLEHGYKELTIPAAAGGGFQIEPNALHIWPRGDYMMIALPNRDGSFTCTLFWPFEGPNSFSEIETFEELRELFASTYPDAIPLMPELEQEYFANPTGSLVTVRCFPWSYKGNVCLIGDSAHAIVPFYGQGANAAFEDCALLADAMAEHDEFEDAFREFARGRKGDADALAQLAIDNFLEMRDSTASARFRLRKRIDNWLHDLLPKIYRPLYSMVTFSLTPYAEAVERAARQERIVRGLLAAAGIAVLTIVGYFGGLLL